MESHRPTTLATAGYYLVTALLALILALGSVVIANTVAGAARGGDMPVGSLSVDATVGSDRVGPLPPGIAVHEDARIQAVLDEPTREQLLLAGGTQVGPFALLVTALWLLRGLARSVRAGEPFGVANVHRLRLLGFLLLLGAPAAQTVNWGLRLALGNTAPLSDMSTAGLSIPVAPLLAGLGALVLAEVFAHGAYLSEDVEATI